MGKRALVLGLGDFDLIRRVSSGAECLVGVGTMDEVRKARKEFADSDNLMFVTGDRQDIPWQEHWFNVIHDPGGEEPTMAMLRALAEGGQIVTER